MRMKGYFFPLLWALVWLLLLPTADAAVFSVTLPDDPPLISNPDGTVGTPGTFRFALLNMPNDEVNTINISAGLNIVLEQGDLGPLVVTTNRLLTTINGNGATVTTQTPLITEGIFIESPTVIRNLRFTGFPERGINIAVDNCVVAGCTVDNNGAEGIFVHFLFGRTADNCIIGGPNEGDRNFIFANGQSDTFNGHGIRLQQVSGTQILNNYIGVGVDGNTDAVGNAGRGIWVENSPNTLIGEAGMGNIIGGSGAQGIFLTGGDTDNVQIFGNFIGVGANKVTSFPNNGGIGMSASNFQDDVTIGKPGAGNVVSGNNSSGIVVEAARNATVQSNFVGADADGEFAIPNAGSGASGISVVSNSTNALIGGTQPGEGNVVCGNLGTLSFAAGIRIGGGSTGARIFGNFVGVGVDGETPLPNSNAGVMVQANDAQVGGAGAGEANTIAFNLGNGVEIKSASGTPADRVRVSHNSIFANAGVGIFVEESSNDNVVPPIIQEYDFVTNVLRGAVERDGIVEVFADMGGQGRIYIGSATSLGGIWALSQNLLAFVPPLAITATLTALNDPLAPTEFRTSAFSESFIIEFEEVTEGEEGEGDDDDPPPPDLVCTPGTIFNQPVAGPISVQCYSSNGFDQRVVFDRFSGVNAGFQTLIWWGVASEVPDIACDPSLLTFLVAVYENDETTNQRGQLIYEELVEVEVTDTLRTVTGLTLKRFTTSLMEQVVVEDENAWISISVPSDDVCRFFWCSSEIGDNIASSLNLSNQEFDDLVNDLSICLLPGLDFEGEGGEEGEVVALNPLDVDLAVTLANDFARFDANGDGSLSREELPMLSDEDFSRLDANGDGRVTLLEIQAYIDENSQRMGCNCSRNTKALDPVDWFFGQLGNLILLSASLIILLALQRFYRA